MLFLGVDVGSDGCCAVLTENNELATYRFKNLTEKDICDIFKAVKTSPNAQNGLFCALEQVNSFPGQGVASSFKFGGNFGLLRGFLYSFDIPFELVRPQTWQKYLGCLSKGDKNITKSMAQRMFPTHKIGHGNADSILMAVYAYRIWHQREYGGINGKKTDGTSAQG